MKIKKVLLVGYIGGINVGDEAIAGAVAKTLKLENVEVYIASGQPSLSRKYLGENYQYVKSVYPGRKIEGSELFSLLQTIKKVDSVIFVGGGILQDVHSTKLIQHCHFIAQFARFFKTPTYALGVGLGPITSEEGIQLAQSFLENVQAVSFRDLESLNYTKTNFKDFSHKCDVSADSIFLLAENFIGSKTGSSGRIGLAFRQWKGINDELLYELVESLILQGKQPVFFAYEQSDLEIFRTLDNKFPSKVELSNETTLTDTLKSISSLEGLISMRLHANLFAIMSNIPFVALSYDNKLKHVIGGIGYGKYVLELNNSPSDILGCLESWKPVASSNDALLNACNLNNKKLMEFIALPNTAFDFNSKGKVRKFISCLNEVYFLYKIQRFSIIISNFIDPVVPNKLKQYIKLKLKLKW